MARLTGEELAAAILKARDKIDKNTDGEGDRFRVFQDFQRKVSHEIMEVMRRNTELIIAGGYPLSNAMNAGGHWAVACTAVSAALSYAVFLNTALNIKMGSPEFRHMELEVSPAMITPHSVADVVAHVLMQLMVTHHELDVDMTKVGESVKQVASTIEPLLTAIWEAKEVRVRN